MTNLFATIGFVLGSLNIGLFICAIMHTIDLRRKHGKR